MGKGWQIRATVQVGTGEWYRFDAGLHVGRIGMSRAIAREMRAVRRYLTTHRVKGRSRLTCVDLEIRELVPGQVDD